MLSSESLNATSGSDHPEFSQVTPRLRFLGAEGRAEAVDLAKSGRCRFSIELTGLRQIRRPFVEVLRCEQSTTLADRRGEYRSVHQGEIALVEEVADRLFGLVADPRDRALPRRSQPEMPVVEEEVDPVLFWLDRIVDRALSINGELRYRELESARRARIRTHLALDFDRRFLSELSEARPAIRRYRVLDENCLQQAGAVPQHDERDLA